MASATSTCACRVDWSGAEQGGDTYRRALAVATDPGMRPLAARCHFGLAKLYRQTNKPDQAREHFTTATTMYREMDMQFWLEQAEVRIESTWRDKCGLPLVEGV